MSETTTHYHAQRAQDTPVRDVAPGVYGRRNSVSQGRDEVNMDGVPAEVLRKIDAMLVVARGFQSFHRKNVDTLRKQYRDATVDERLEFFREIAQEPWHESESKATIFDQLLAELHELRKLATREGARR